MSSSWKEAYSELTEFIAKHPEIEIGMKIIKIPDNVRPEFYQLFDVVRTAFIEQKFANLVSQAMTLSQNYLKIKQEVTESLGLDDISIGERLGIFLNDPIKGLIRDLFDPLFNMIKGKIDTDIFEHAASISVDNSFSKLFHSGYEKWVILSLVSLLDPDKVLTVPVEDLYAEPESKIGLVPGLPEEFVPSPKEIKGLPLEHVEETVFIVPDFIVHSAKLNRYISMRANMVEVSWAAKQVSEKREWERFRDVMGLYTPRAHWPELVVYMDDKPEDIAIVADFGRFCRPDVIVECMEQADWYQRSGLNDVKLNHNLLKPMLGSYVVSRLPVPEEAVKELMAEPVAAVLPAEHVDLPREMKAEQKESVRLTEEVVGLPVSEKVPQVLERRPLDIHILGVGYDRSQLTPIVEALSSKGKIAYGPESQ